MTINGIPPGLAPAGGSLNFTNETVPGALQRKHALGPGRWGVLHVFEGSLVYVDLESGREFFVRAPGLVTISPEAPHRIVVEQAVSCRVDFFREPDMDSPARTPGSYAGEAVLSSLERCEAAGDFGEAFYEFFLRSSPEVGPYFAETDFERQRQVLLDSVRTLVSRDVAEPEVREMLDRLGRAHSRDGRNVLPRLYELWLNSVCETAKSLDPDWSPELEREWRVRLRPGIQVIMAAY